MDDYGLKIKKAVLQGINEAFDLGDMDNDITPVAATKRKVQKHSKLYAQVYGILDKVNPARMYFECSEEDMKFMCSIYEGFEGMGEEMM